MKKSSVLIVLMVVAITAAVYWIGRPAAVPAAAKPASATVASPVPATAIKDAVTQVPATQLAVPVPHPTVQVAPPTPRGDPQRSQQNEASEADKIFATYLKQADMELPKLQDQLAQQRAQGAEPDKVTETEEKIRRITAMRDQLLQQHPELARH